MNIRCPKCQAESEGEATRIYFFYDCKCFKCGFDFCYDEPIGEYYDMKGNEIKEPSDEKKE